MSRVVASFLAVLLCLSSAALADWSISNSGNVYTVSVTSSTTTVDATVNQSTGYFTLKIGGTNVGAYGPCSSLNITTANDGGSGYSITVHGDTTITATNYVSSIKAFISDDSNGGSDLKLDNISGEIHCGAGDSTAILNNSFEGYVYGGSSADDIYITGASYGVTVRGGTLGSNMIDDSWNTEGYSSLILNPWGGDTVYTSFVGHDGVFGGYQLTDGAYSININGPNCVVWDGQAGGEIICNNDPNETLVVHARNEDQWTEVGTYGINQNNVIYDF